MSNNDLDNGISINISKFKGDPKVNWARFQWTCQADIDEMNIL